MTLPSSAPAPGRVTHGWIPCAVVALTGLIEAVVGSGSLVVVGDIAEMPNLSPAELATLALMALHLLLGLAAIGFAVTRRLRLGIAALAVWALVRWSHDLPSLMHTTLEIFSGAGFSDTGIILFKTFGQPLLSAAALAAAWFNRELAPAALALAVMTLVDVAELALFAIAVSLYGA